MKAIIILILSLLLFSYSISAEEKNGSVTVPVKNSKIKVLEERINGNENQLKALKDELALSSKPMKIWYLLAAVFLGAVLGFFGTEISACRRRKEEQIEKRKTLTGNIIDDSLKFIFKANDFIRNLIQKKKESGELTGYLEDFKEDYKKWHVPEKRYYEYQLKRLGNEEITKEFESLMKSQHELCNKLFANKPSPIIQGAESEYHNLLKRLISNCTKITKI